MDIDSRSFKFPPMAHAMRINTERRVQILNTRLRTRIVLRRSMKILPPRRWKAVETFCFLLFRPVKKLCARPSKILGGVSNRVQPPCTRNVARCRDTYKPANAQRLPRLLSFPPPDTIHRLFNARDNPLPPFHRTLSRRRRIFAYAVGGASNEFYEPAYRLHGLI